MMVRQSILAGSWYPDNEKECRDFIQSVALAANRTALAVVSPHAGWFFSGALSCEAIGSLNPDMDLIVVCGGHVRAGDPFLFWDATEVSTPVGAMIIDTDFQNFLSGHFMGKTDRAQDNTIEVQLPIVKYFFPEASLGALRVPSDKRAQEAGLYIAEYAKRTGKKIAVVGSTDLTHYGPNYGFEPKKDTQQALQWIKDVNDKKFIDALCSMDFDQALFCANESSSACSSGAAVCAGSYAKEQGRTTGNLAGYSTSYEKHKADSFVGYASIVF